jgi:hypothetical protein
MSIFSTSQMSCAILLTLLGLFLAGLAGNPGVFLVLFVFLIMLLASSVQIIADNGEEEREGMRAHV